MSDTGFLSRDTTAGTLQQGHYSRDTTAGTLQQGHYSRVTTAGTLQQGSLQQGHYSRDTTAGTLQQGHYSRDTTAGTLQQGHYSRVTTAGTLQQGHYSRDTTAGSLQQGHYSRDTTAGTLQQGHYSRDTTAGTLQQARGQSECPRPAGRRDTVLMSVRAWGRVGAQPPEETPRARWIRFRPAGGVGVRQSLRQTVTLRRDVLPCDPTPPGSAVTQPDGRNMKVKLILNLNLKSGENESEESRGERRKLRLKIPGKIWRNRRTQQENPAGRGEHSRRTQQENTAEEDQGLKEDRDLKEDQDLEEQSSRLISREERLFGQEERSEEEEDRLQKDLEDLLLQVWMAVHNTFSTSSPGEQEALRSAVASVRQQEAQDRRWAGCLEGRVPVWRPQKCLGTHAALLWSMVESRLRSAAEDDSSGPSSGLSSSLKREVCRTGKRLKEDLLTLVRKVKDCYPPEFDILNLYAGLYQRAFALRLAELASGPDLDDCSYLLFWVNHYYPNEILNHEELEGKIKTACLGSLLLQEDLERLEEQYLTYKEGKVKLWLWTALKKEEENWQSGREPDIIDQYCFSPLAVDVIQVVDGSLTEASSVLRDQRKTQRITAHLDSFFTSYKSSLEEFLKGNHDNSQSVMKANLVCIEQFRDFVSSRAGSLSEQQISCCMETLSVLKDYGYGYFTRPIHNQLKVWYSQIWTVPWLDGSVLDQLLDSLDRQLSQFTDLKPVCREALLSRLHEQVLLQYVKRMMRMNARMKSREQQVGGASRMSDDAHKIKDFFTEG
ncbi:tumor necrosis factor alpha-induced protein 2-like, partial [Centroberyx affinis]|uniref:tumor necrosis factor alpha-induced protein 2-like n=1 Tax=Centroberyx affinis TaxID=166261 RepID=UPI003A5C26C5